MTPITSLREEAEEPKLKPCPFCGGHAAIAREDDADGFGMFLNVSCRSCRASTAQQYASNGNDCPQTYAEVRAAWNRRATPSPSHAEYRSSGERGEAGTDGVTAVALTTAVAALEEIRRLTRKLLDEPEKWNASTVLTRIFGLTVDCVTAGELPDAVRVPLDELEADARYLAARLANGTMAPSIGAEAIQKRTRAIRAALLALGVALPDGGQHGK